MIVTIDSKLVYYEKRIQNLCKVPFYGHPKGCPNHGRKEGCPPHQPLIDGIFDLNSELYVIYTEFAVGEFAERMRETHPKWSEHPRQWYNPRRWQPRARKEHRKEIERFLIEHESLIVNSFPEAHGVNVTKLMENIGITLDWQWPPKHNLENKTYIVSLGGEKL